MGLVAKILHFRLDVDTEYQGWILLFATLTAIWVFCMPCYCAGWSCPWARRFAAWIQQRLPYFLFVAAIFNAGMLFLIVTWLPDWGYADYAKMILGGLLFLAKNLMKFITSIALIVVFIFVFVFKDKIAKVAGIEYKTLFRCRLRDICPGGKQTRAIELVVQKVDNLPAASIFAPNNVFLEAHLGYNEPMKTRVHNNAGSSCFLKERIQLNFDPDEDEELLYLFVKNQKVMGAGELCHIEKKPSEVMDLEKESKRRRTGDEWQEGTFIPVDLIPRGTIYLRVENVDDEDYHAMSC